LIANQGYTAGALLFLPLFADYAGNSGVYAGFHRHAGSMLVVGSLLCNLLSVSAAHRTKRCRAPWPWAMLVVSSYWYLERVAVWLLANDSAPARQHLEPPKRDPRTGELASHV